MMLGPVELDTPAYPRTCKSNQSRLDDMVVVDEVSLFNLVVSHLNPTTEFGQNHYFDIFVFNVYGIILFVHPLITYTFNDGVRINHSA